MPDSLPELERRRADLLIQVSHLADFRPGSITSTQGRCGNPNCHCHKAGEPGHGPNPRLTYKVDGKTVTESFATPAAQRKAEREVAEFARYREWSRAFVEVNAQICRARPVEETLSPQEKKTAEAIRQEVARELEQLLRTIFTGVRKTGHLDLQAVEMLVRSAMHQAGANVLTELLQLAEPDQRTIPCPCGQQARYREMRSKAVLTAVGTVELSRPYYLCPHCQEGQFPADHVLDILHTGFSPGVRRMQALVGQDAPFDHGREQMKLLAGLEVTTKSVERVAEAIGADIARQEQQEIDRAMQLDLPIIIGEPPHATAGFTTSALDGYGLRCQLPTRPAPYASDPVLVHRLVRLLHASFRSRLATTPLRFAVTSPPSGCEKDFHLRAVEHARHTTKEPGCRPGSEFYGGPRSEDVLQGGRLRMLVRVPLMMPKLAPALLFVFGLPNWGDWGN